MKRSQIEIPIWERYCLTIDEAAAYSLIGRDKLREYINENKHVDFVLWSGSTARIKRPQFEKFLENMNYM